MDSSFIPASSPSLTSGKSSLLCWSWPIFPIHIVEAFLITSAAAPLLPGFMNCARHCWCAYADDDPRVAGMEVIVQGFKAHPHKHSPDPEAPNGCTGCAIEEGRVTWRWRETPDAR
mgnify:CR=1 FL=1